MLAWQKLGGIHRRSSATEAPERLQGCGQAKRTKIDREYGDKPFCLAGTGWHLVLPLASWREPTCRCPPQGVPLYGMETCGCEAPGGSPWTAMGPGCGLLTGLRCAARELLLPASRSTPTPPLARRGPGARHERLVGERALLPVLLPTLPGPHRRQARLPASRAHLLSGT